MRSPDLSPYSFHFDTHTVYLRNPSKRCNLFGHCSERSIICCRETVSLNGSPVALFSFRAALYIWPRLQNSAISQLTFMKFTPLIRFELIKSKTAFVHPLRLNIVIKKIACMMRLTF